MPVNLGPVDRRPEGAPTPEGRRRPKLYTSSSSSATVDSSVSSSSSCQSSISTSQVMFFEKIQELEDKVLEQEAYIEHLEAACAMSAEMLAGLEVTGSRVEDDIRYTHYEMEVREQIAEDADMQELWRDAPDIGDLFSHEPMPEPPPSRYVTE